MDLLGPRLINTFYLSMSSLLLALLIAIPLGIWAALHAGSKIDYGLSFLSSAGISMPSFWLGIVLIIVFGIWWPLFPPGGTSSIGIEDGTAWEIFVDRLSYLVLPTLSLTIMQMGRFVRFTRSSMLEALRHDYIRTAKAKSLSQSVILWRHAFRNALIPLITVITLSFSSLFSGALITETVFAYQGVGKLVYESIRGNDFNVAMVSFLISISMVLLFNLLADLLYAAADPRISYH
jgi:peptide/nickel transport system permease protein